MLHVLRYTISMMFLLAALPLLIFFMLVLLARRPVFESALVTLVLITLIGAEVWGMEMGRIASAAGKGAFIATEIIFIILGALLIFEILKKKDLMKPLKGLFEWISKDSRVHVILIGWALVYFIEGVAGFGTPAMIAVPIFLALGFSAITAVSLAIIGDSVPVIFGAIGLPVTYGIGSVLDSLGADSTLIESLPILIAHLNVIGSILVPLGLVYIYCRAEKKPKGHFREFMPFAIMAGLVTAVASVLTVAFLGPELPSVVGGAAALVVISYFAKKKLFLPRMEKDEIPDPALQAQMHGWEIVRAMMPYAILVGLLMLSRLPFLPFKGFLMGSVSISIPQLFSNAIDYSFQPLYSAGVLACLSALLAMMFLRLNVREVKSVVGSTLKRVWRPYFALLAVLALVQVFIYSGENALGIVSMPVMLASAASGLLGGLWPFVSPFVGALGAFAAGSATVSNLIFTGFQYETALASGFDPLLVLSLQGLGAAAGNVIAFHNVIAALAVTELVGKEREVIKRNAGPLLVYLVVIGIVGVLLSYKS